LTPNDGLPNPIGSDGDNIRTPNDDGELSGEKLELGDELVLVLPLASLTTTANALLRGAAAAEAATAGAGLPKPALPEGND
jgi:hypothetical protein